VVRIIMEILDRVRICISYPACLFCTRIRSEGSEKHETVTPGATLTVVYTRHEMQGVN
jgi:hypothetical protein